MLYYLTTCAAFDAWLDTEARASIFEVTETADREHYVILVDESSNEQIDLLMNLEGAVSFDLDSFNAYVEENPDIFVSETTE